MIIFDAFSEKNAQYSIIMHIDAFNARFVRFWCVADRVCSNSKQ
jgi:hypothetical protein